MVEICFQCLSFSEKVSDALSGVPIRFRIKVRWKVLTLAHRTVGQTPEFDYLESTSLHLKWRSCQMNDFLSTFCKLQTQLHDNLVISKLTRSAPNARNSTFGPPFDVSGKLLSSSLWNSAARLIGEPMKHSFWKWEQNVSTKCMNYRPEKWECACYTLVPTPFPTTTSLLQINRNSSHTCHFTNKNILDNPKKLVRLLPRYCTFLKKNFEGREPLISSILTLISKFLLINWKTNLPKFLQILKFQRKKAQNPRSEGPPNQKFFSDHF